MPTQRRRKRYAAHRSSARGKGDILEAAVLSLHEGPGLTVERNVFLPIVDASGRTREIDVLVSATVAGYPVRVAIECKNEVKPVGPGKIDAFIGKLDDVGIPRQHGVFVTPTRFTSGALKRAKSAAIEVLLFEDLSTALPEAVSTAFQSIVYLLLTVSNIRIANDQPGPALAGEMLFFRDSTNRVVGGVPDLVWQMWTNGELPTTLGEHDFHLALPEGWRQVVNGKDAKVNDIHVTVLVTAHAVTFPGTVRGSALVRPDTKEITKFTAQAEFPRPKGVFPVHQLRDENELSEWVSTRKGISITVGRVRLPRLRWASLYWPPSDKATATLAQLFLRSMRDGGEFDLSRIPIEEIEGTDLNAIWDPIAKFHPSQFVEGDTNPPKSASDEKRRSSAA